MTYSESATESSAQSSAQSSEQSSEPTASENEANAYGLDVRVSDLETECAVMREWMERINAIVVRISDSALRTH
jgi:hypothetical protein